MGLALQEGRGTHVSAWCWGPSGRLFGQPSSCWWLKSLPSASPLLRPASPLPLPHPALEQGVLCCRLWEGPGLHAGLCRQMAGVREGNRAGGQRWTMSGREDRSQGSPSPIQPSPLTKCKGMNEIKFSLVDLVSAGIPRDFRFAPSFSTTITESAYCVPGGHPD